MPLDAVVLSSFTLSYAASSYVRITPWAHRATPLGMGYGHTRFASPEGSFKLIYIAQDLPTSIAEAIVRDRFEGRVDRVLMRSDMTDWGGCEVSTAAPLTLLDLRGDACFELDVSTDITGAKAQGEARAFSQALYDDTDLDGIVYHSRLRKEQDCIAVYDRAVSTKLSASPVEQLETLVELVPALRDLRISLIA